MQNNTGSPVGNMGPEVPANEGEELKEDEFPKGPLLLSERPTLMGGTGGSSPSRTSVFGNQRSAFRRAIFLTAGIVFCIACFCHLLMVICTPRPEPAAIVSFPAPQPYVAPANPVPASPAPSTPKSPLAQQGSGFTRMTVRQGSLSATLNPGSRRGSTTIYTPTLDGCAVFSHNGRWVADCLSPSGVGVWNVSTNKLIRIFAEEANGYQSLSFSENARTLIVMPFHGVVRAWDVNTGRSKWQIDAGSGELNCNMTSIDNRTLATAGKSHSSDMRHWEVKLWNARTGVLERTLSQEESVVTALRFSNDGTELVGTEEEGPRPGGQIVLWNLESDAPAIRRSVPGIWNTEAAFSRDDRTLVTAGYRFQRPQPTADDPAGGRHCYLSAEVTVRDARNGVPAYTFQCYNQITMLAPTPSGNQVDVLESGIWMDRLSLRGPQREIVSCNAGLDPPSSVPDYYAWPIVANWEADGPAKISRLNWQRSPRPWFPPDGQAVKG